VKQQRSLVAALTLALLLALAATVGRAQSPALPLTVAGFEARQDDPIELLIITPAEFQPVLVPLVAHKNATGIPTDLLTLEEIYGRPAHFGDEAQRVKQAIALEASAGLLSYVMLVGDVDRFPVRWVASMRGADVEYYYPSDLYYADLYDSSGRSATWDADADGLYGEHGCSSDPARANPDGLDFHPDVAVGRVPASTIEEVEGYVAKIIRYERLTFGSAWFRNMLFIAGHGRSESQWCDPGINFAEVQSDFAALGGPFTFRTWMDVDYYAPAVATTGRPCMCQAGETDAQCLARTLLPSTQSTDLFAGAGRWRAESPPTPVPVAEFENVGFLAWHDHTSSVRDYVRHVNNADRFSIAFADGCGDGAFAGPEVGSLGRFGEAYRTTDGHLLQVENRRVALDTDGDGESENYYHVDGCSLDGTAHALDGSHCAGGIYPDMVLTDDFGLDASATVPVGRDSPYVLNPPPPSPIQTDHWERNPENKLLLAKSGTTGQETGWVGMVGATKGATFPFNGEMLELFFEGYARPDASVLGRNRLGDVWRSMMERWLRIVFDAGGAFSLDHIATVYHYDRDDCSNWTALQHAIMYNLFGDPSLRIGGLDIEADTEPPSTSDNSDGAWHNRPVEVRLTSVDGGDPPSGVRWTKYRVGTTAGLTVGTRFTIDAPPDHANDGVHTVEYFSEDFLDNIEITKSTQVRIDTVPPVTVAAVNPAATTLAPPGPAPSMGASPAQDPSDGPQALLFYPAAALPPERPCYNKSALVTLDAEDDRSGLSATWYTIDGRSYGSDWWQSYDGTPFAVRAWDYVALPRVEFWSEDNAGNWERSHLLTLCITNFEAGLMRDKLRVLAALEEIVAMRMRQDLASTLPPIKAVAFAYQLRDEPDSQWMPIATDYVGSDGWSVEWKTTDVPNGHYGIEMTVWGFPLTQAAVPQADPVLYTEEVGVAVSNFPDAAYDFGLYAWPAQIDRGQSIEYTLEFVNNTGGPLQDLAMTCVLDPALFEQLEVFDGGSLDSYGMPTWSLAAMEPGDTWKAHFNAKTSPRIVPGTVIANQAFLTADRVPRLLSDDPSTAVVRAPAADQADWTAVTVNLLKASIFGQVEDSVTGVPVAASVTLSGPVFRVVETDTAGGYALQDLPPGTYNVSVQAEDYGYGTPEAPVTLTLDGIVEDMYVGFQLERADIIPPVSALHRTVEEIVLAHSVEISGTAYDYPPGSGVQKVELSILRLEDMKYWDGASWLAGETWLLASGTADWTLDCAGIAWGGDAQYSIQSRATDNAGNLERPAASETEPALPAPRLGAPADGWVTNQPPTFEWALVTNARYRLQVDEEPDFQSPRLDASDLDRNRYTPLRLAGGTYYWRVQAVNADYGSPVSQWSEVWTVSVQSRTYLPLLMAD
jgi:hypothetical protein